MVAAVTCLKHMLHFYQRIITVLSGQHLMKLPCFIIARLPVAQYEDNEPNGLKTWTRPYSRLNNPSYLLKLLYLIDRCEWSFCEYFKRASRCSTEGEDKGIPRWYCRQSQLHCVATEFSGDRAEHSFNKNKPFFSFKWVLNTFALRWFFIIHNKSRRGLYHMHGNGFCC